MNFKEIQDIIRREGGKIVIVENDEPQLIVMAFDEYHKNGSKPHEVHMERHPASPQPARQYTEPLRSHIEELSSAPVHKSTLPVSSPMPPAAQPRPTSPPPPAPTPAAQPERSEALTIDDLPL